MLFSHMGRSLTGGMQVAVWGCSSQRNADFEETELLSRGRSKQTVLEVHRTLCWNIKGSCPCCIPVTFKSGLPLTAEDKSVRLRMARSAVEAFSMPLARLLVASARP